MYCAERRLWFSSALLIIGCDFHTRYQQIAMLDEATGELGDSA